MVAWCQPTLTCWLVCCWGLRNAACCCCCCCCMYSCCCCCWAVAWASRVTLWPGWGVAWAGAAAAWAAGTAVAPAAAAAAAAAGACGGRAAPIPTPGGKSVLLRGRRRLLFGVKVDHKNANTTVSLIPINILDVISFFLFCNHLKYI